jgi:iron complex transport system substrate-binding protein
LKGFLVALLLGMTLQATAADRVIALSPHLAELACAAGGCDKLVGAVAWSDYPERVKALPQVGDAYAVNLEQVLSLQPDLVLAWEGGTPRETQERLQALKLRVERVSIRGLDEVADGLRRVGALLGTPGSAEMAAQRYAARLAQLRARHQGAAPKLRVYYQIELEPAYSINADSPISQAIALCGGINVFADLPTLAATVNREAVLARDPQVLLYSRQDDGEAIRAYWKRAGLSATRAGAFYEIDGNLLDRATPRLLDGVEQVCAALSDARAALVGKKGLSTAPPARPSPAPAPAPPRTDSPTGG